LKAISAKLKEERTKPDFWIKKHKDEAAKRKKSAFPDIGTYKPFPVEY
jgi:hypothetical protein